MRAVNKIGLNDSIVDSRLKVVFHTCRHSFASWLVADGADLFTVRELMGHKSIAMTERYSHLSPDTLRKAVKSMETAIQSKQELMCPVKEMMPFRLTIHKKSTKIRAGLVNNLSMKGMAGKESTPLSVCKVCHVCYIETEPSQ